MSISGEHTVDASTASQIQDYLADYGETLVPLPDATWESSVSQWMGGHWDVVVDLFTEESGRSDLVLAARVFDDRGSLQIVVDGVFVP